MGDEQLSPPREVTPATRFSASRAGPPESPSQVPWSPTHSCWALTWLPKVLVQAEPTQSTVRLSRRRRVPESLALSLVMPKPMAVYVSLAARATSTRGTRGTASVGAMLSARMMIA